MSLEWLQFKGNTVLSKAKMFCFTKKEKDDVRIVSGRGRRHLLGWDQGRLALGIGWVDAWRWGHPECEETFMFKGMGAGACKAQLSLPLSLWDRTLGTWMPNAPFHGASTAVEWLEVQKQPLTPTF